MLGAYGAAAAATMLKIMVDPAVPASTRLRAADCVFTHAKNAIEIEEIEARVGALERAAAEAKTGALTGRPFKARSDGARSVRSRLALPGRSPLKSHSREPALTFVMQVAR
jgi:hypothetical protein